MSSLESCTNALLQQKAVQNSNHDNLERHILELQRTRRAACLTLHLLIEDVTRRTRDLRELREHNTHHFSELQQSCLKLAALQLVTRESRNRGDQMNATLTQCEQAWKGNTPTHWAAVIAALQQQSMCVQACPAFCTALQKVITVWEAQYRIDKLHQSVTSYVSNCASCLDQFTQRYMPQRVEVLGNRQAALQRRQTHVCTKQTSLIVTRWCAEQERCALRAMCEKMESLVCVWQELSHAASSQLAFVTNAVAEQNMNECKTSQALWCATVWRKQCVDVLRGECCRRHDWVTTELHARKAMLQAMIDSTTKLRRAICRTGHAEMRLSHDDQGRVASELGHSQDADPSWTENEAIFRGAGAAATLTTTTTATTTTTNTAGTNTTPTRTATNDGKDGEVELERDAETAETHRPDVFADNNNNNNNEEAPRRTAEAMSDELTQCHLRVHALRRLNRLTQMLQQVWCAAMAERRARWARERCDRARQLTACRWWRGEVSRLCSRHRDVEQATEAEEMLTRRSLYAMFVQQRKQQHEQEQEQQRNMTEQKGSQQQPQQERQQHKEEQDKRIKSTDAAMEKVWTSAAAAATVLIPDTTSIQTTAPETQGRSTAQHSSRQVQSDVGRVPAIAVAEESDDVGAAMPAPGEFGGTEEVLLSPAAHSVSHRRLPHTRTHPAPRKRRPSGTSSSNAHAKNTNPFGARTRAVHAPRSLKHDRAVRLVDQENATRHGAKARDSGAAAATSGGTSSDMHDTTAGLCDEHWTRRTTHNAQGSSSTTNSHLAAHNLSDEATARILSSAATAPVTDAAETLLSEHKCNPRVHSVTTRPTHTPLFAEHDSKSDAEVMLPCASESKTHHNPHRTAHCAASGLPTPLPRPRHSPSTSVAHSSIPPSLSSPPSSSLVAASSSPSEIVASATAPLQYHRRSPLPRCPRWLPRRQRATMESRTTVAAATTATTGRVVTNSSDNNNDGNTKRKKDSHISNAPCLRRRRAAPKARLHGDGLWCGIAPATAVRSTLPRPFLNVAAGEDIFADIFS